VAKYLQPAFDKENKRKKNAPFSTHLTKKEIDNILNRSITQSDRYRGMKKEGYSDEEIRKSFNVPVEMTIFSYKGEIDTTMTPLDSIRYYKSFLRSGFMSMDPKTGQVKAYVGGLNYAHFQYDMASDGRRQVGSTMKPLLYSLAMENGFSPCDEAPNWQQTYMVNGQPWTPRNSNQKRAGEMVTLKWGLAQSSNWVSAYLMSQLDPQQFVSLLRQYGINNPEIVPSMALCLGPCDITVSEMVSAYTAFANHGIRCAPMLVSRIEDNEGNVVARFEPRVTEVISEESSYKMLALLQGVIDGGTGGRLRFKYGIKAQMGGKTGTTNRNSDAWFMAVAPNLVSGCWVGGEDRDIHFDNMFYGQGASMALPIYAYYIQKVYKDESLPYSENDTFDVPHGYDACASSGGKGDTGPSVEDVFE
jgi:penicillin-binding protein 1A